MLLSQECQKSSLLEDDPKALNLVVAFASTLGSKINELERALIDKNSLELKQLTHKLKGSAALYGFDILNKALQEFECYLVMSQEHLYHEKFIYIKDISGQIIFTYNK